MKVVFVVSILYIFLYAMYLNLSFAFGKIRDPRRDNMYLCILVVAMAVFGSSINPPSHGWDLYRHYQYLEALRTANYSLLIICSISTIFWEAEQEADYMGLNYTFFNESVQKQ